MRYRLKKSSKSKKRKSLLKEDFWVQFNRVHNKHLNMSMGAVEIRINEKKD
jgi:hypothetical protein